MRRPRTGSEESVYATAMPTNFSASMHGVIRIKFRYIPPFLHRGTFYSHLDANDPDQPFDIPSSCFLASDTVRDIFEFAQMLRVCMFWGLSEIPRGVYIFCSSVRHDIWIDVARDVFHMQRVWLQTLVVNCKNYRSIGSAIKLGHPEVVNHWIESNPYNPDDVALNDAIIQAVAAGNLPLVMQLRERNYPWHEQTSVVAAYCGHMDCLEFILENGCPLSPDTMAWAAEGGHLQCLQYAHKKKCPFNKNVFKYATRRGHKDCLAYLLEHEWPWDPCVTLDYMPADCLEYVLKQGCAVHREACRVAAQQGRVVCLALLHTHLVGRHQEALRRGMQRALQGVPAQSFAAQLTLKHAQDLLLSPPHWVAAVTDAAAEFGQTAALEYALENGCPANVTACSLAAYNGHLACLQVLRKFEAPWEETVLTMAAKDGNLDILRFALGNDCPCRDSTTLLLAVVHSGMNVVPCLSYLIDTLSLEMTPELFCVALERGDVETVSYLVDGGCMCVYTAARRNLKIGAEANVLACIEYALGHGCNCTDDLLDWVVENKFETCAQCIREFLQHPEYSGPDGEMDAFWGFADYVGRKLSGFL